MNSPAYDISDKINADGQASLGVDLFSAEWGKPNQQFLVLDGVSAPSDLVFTYEEVGVQIITRGEKNEPQNEVYLRAKTLSDYLLNLPDNWDVNGCGYKSFEPTSNIAALGKDANERHTYSMNFFTYRAGV